MKKIIFGLLVVLVAASVAFADATEDLMAAVINKDIKPMRIRLLLKDGANVNGKDEDNRTILMWAVSENNNLEILKMLINASADVNAKDNDGMTALLWASRETNDPEIIRLLIQAGADVSATDKDGTTAQEFADGNANPEVQKLAKVIFARSKDALLDAIKREDITLDEISALISYGADVNAKDNDGVTVLMWAAGLYDKPEFLNALTKAGADISAKDNDGKTARDYAQENGNAENVKLLTPPPAPTPAPAPAKTNTNTKRTNTKKGK